MKTTHQLARELLALPDLPVFHFDPSRAGLDDENDTSLSEPKLDRDDASGGLDEADIAEFKEEGRYMGEFVTISGEQGQAGEAMTDTESDRLFALKALDHRVHTGYDFNADPDKMTLLVGAAIAGKPRPLSDADQARIDAAWERHKAAGQPLKL